MTVDLVLIALISAAASLITLFSGFGLATILTPVFMFFFPVEIAIALTGVVHLFNGAFKLGLLGRHADWKIAASFGIPSIIGAVIGAELLVEVSRMPAIAHYELFDRQHAILPAKVMLSVIIAVFAFAESVPPLRKEAMSRQNVMGGGLLSGFFGGVSGYQGALRSAFLIHYRLSKEQFLATGIVIACMVDVTRLSLYATQLNTSAVISHWPVVITAILSAFTGAYIGSRLLRNVTLEFVRRTVMLFLILIALLLGAGII